MKKFFDSAIQILTEARENGITQKKLAERAGILPSTLGRWLKGTRGPTLVQLGKVFDVLGVSLQESGLPPDEYIFVDKVAVKTDEPYRSEEHVRISGQFAFRRSFLGKVGISDKAPILMEVSGDSMEPFIRIGDTIMVDQTVKQLQDNKIFVICMAGQLMFRRSMRQQRGWQLCCLNPERPHIDIDDGPDSQLEVIGRVCWFGRVV